MATEKLIYAHSGTVAAEYLEKHLIVGDSDFLKGYLAGIKALAEGLEKLPAVDAVKVVRCKDCEYRHSSEFCESRPADGYCNDGERKCDGNGQ